MFPPMKEDGNFPEHSVDRKSLEGLRVKRFR